MQVEIVSRVMTTTTPLTIFCGGAMRPLLRELVPAFERAYDVAVGVEFRLSAALKRAIRDGAAFDIAILPRPELDELIACGAIVRDSVVNVARSTVGLAVRAGAPKPDIGSRRGAAHCCKRARSPTATVRAVSMSQDCWQSSGSAKP